MPHSCVFYRNSAARGNLRLWSLHWIAQHANADDTDFHYVTSGQWADASRRAGGDHIAGHQRHHAGNPAHEKGWRINHERGGTALPARPIDMRLDQYIRGV